MMKMNLFWKNLTNLTNYKELHPTPIELEPEDENLENRWIYFLYSKDDFVLLNSKKKRLRWWFSTASTLICKRVIFLDQELIWCILLKERSKRENSYKKEMKWWTVSGPAFSIIYEFKKKKKEKVGWNLWLIYLCSPEGNNVIWCGNSVGRRCGKRSLRNGWCVKNRSTIRGTHIDIKCRFINKNAISHIVHIYGCPFQDSFISDVDSFCIISSYGMARELLHWEITFMQNKVFDCAPLQVKTFKCFS